MSQPLVSVVMTVFNGEAYIREAMDSILEQTYANLEFLIVNDCSTDGTVDIVRSYTDPRIRLLENETNQGICLSRNKAFLVAKGKYIATLDSDDISTPDRLQRQVDYLESHPGVAVCGTFFQVMDKSGKLGAKFSMPIRANSIRANLLLWNCMCNSTIMVRREVALEVPFDRDYELAEDYEVWYRISQRYDLHNLPFYSCHYRVHPGSVSVMKRFARMLEDTGFRFNPRELDLHAKAMLFRKEHFEGGATVDEFEKWCLKLAAHVKTLDKRRYDQSSFFSYLANTWIIMNIHNRSWGKVLFNGLALAHPYLYYKKLLSKAIAKIFP
jgi:glycosyltransferase involved in cell wall biosynthesis